MIKPLNFAATALVPLVIAGTCLATPVVANAATATNVEAAVATQAAEEGTVLAKGKLQVTVPESFSVESDDFAVIATSADGNMVAYLADVETGTMPTSADELGTLFGEVSATSVEENGGTVTDSGVSWLADGTEVYVYYYTMDFAGIEFGTYLVYLPYETGFSFAQLAAPADISGDDYTTFEAIVSSLLPAQAAALEAPEGYQVVEADGIGFVIPEDLADAGDGSWVSDGQDFMIGGLGVMTEGASTLTDEEYDQIVSLLGEQLGTIHDTATIDGNGVSYKAIAFEYTDEGTAYSGIVAFVPNAKDELIGLLCLVDNDGSYANASEVAETVFTSVTVL